MSSKLDKTTSSLIGNDIVILPRNVFSNRFSYFICTHKAFLLALTSGISILSLLSWFNRQDISGAVAVIWIIGLPLLAVIVPITFVAARHIGLTKMNELTFLEEISRTKPELDMKKWDSIAGRLNSMFYENSSSATPYFFYDGEACASLFRSHFLEPYLKRQQVANSRPEATSPETEQAKWGSSELEPFIAEAVNAYQESLKSRWNRLTRGEASDGNIV